MTPVCKALKRSRSLDLEHLDLVLPPRGEDAQALAGTVADEGLGDRGEDGHAPVVGRRLLGLDQREAGRATLLAEGDGAAEGDGLLHGVSSCGCDPRSWGQGCC